MEFSHRLSIIVAIENMEEPVMVIVSRMISIGIITSSLIIGCISFLVFSDLKKAEKKVQIERLTSQLINFIIYIWLGKIILNIALFVQDPLAVLAYPANSDAFYLATLFTVMTVIYQSYRKRLNILAFSEGIIHVILVGLFFYEFIQMTFEGNPYSFGYIILVFCLLIVFFFIRGRTNSFTLVITILIGWTIGLLLLNLLYPFVTLFGYLIETWFIIAFFITCLLILIINERKRIS